MTLPPRPRSPPSPSPATDTASASKGRFRSRKRPQSPAGVAPSSTLSSEQSDDHTDFLGSQVDRPSVINYSYTDEPYRLLLWDFYYFFFFVWALPWIVWPLQPASSDLFDELAPTRANLWCLAVHGVLVVLQLAFIVGLPFLALVPVWTAVLALALFFAVNTGLCRLLNGRSLKYHSDPKYAAAREEHAHESWIFVNGVAAGEAWMLANINRLALTFGRPVTGIHNKTAGILFDVVECLVQRNLNFATKDVREAYRVLKAELYNPAKSKVIFILHSQGAIEGSLVMDWLLQELPQDLLAKLEVYTFGAAANHMNSPAKHDAHHARACADAAANAAAKDPRPRLDPLRTDSGRRSLTGDDLTDSPTLMRAPTNASDKWQQNGNQPNHHDRPPTPPTLPGQEEPSGGGDGDGEHADEKDGSATAPPKRAHSILPPARRVIGHIEHYAHTTDFVALWGVLHFTTNKGANPLIPRFIGRVFSRTSPRGGHQFNQHYLNGMFPLARDPDTGAPTGADEANPFMASVVARGAWGTEGNDDVREGFVRSLALLAGGDVSDSDDGEPERENARRRASKAKGHGDDDDEEEEDAVAADGGLPVEVHGSFRGRLPARLDRGTVTVADLSRLWLYRNGRSPPEPPRGLRRDADGVVRAGTL